MKLKEIPVSIFQSAYLSFTPAERLGRNVVALAENCIVSLTTIESRLPIIHLTIRSLLAQTVRPEKIVLWVNEHLKESIPPKLSRLVGSRFEICFSEQHCSHRKLVESIKQYPDKIIVTCDDDEMYSSSWLARLWEDHLRYPQDIIAHECRRISFDRNGALLPYKDWQGESFGRAAAETLAIGYGGVVYPVGSLHEDVLRRDMYDELAPRADDLWFKAMSLRNGTKTRRSYSPHPKPVPILRSQQVSLKKHNVRQDGNRSQWQALMDYFSIDFSKSI